MPQNKKAVKNEANVVKKFRIPHKLLIGTRKTGISAFTMSTVDLLDVIKNTDKNRYHNNAKAALVSRGISF